MRLLALLVLAVLSGCSPAPPPASYAPPPTVPQVQVPQGLSFSQLDISSVRREVTKQGIVYLYFSYNTYKHQLPEPISQERHTLEDWNRLFSIYRIREPEKPIAVATIENEPISDLPIVSPHREDNAPAEDPFIPTGYPTQRDSQGAGSAERLSPQTAENGSYYGEISENTGRPKTVHVSGYYRKDGTYVRGHYRSSPRRR